MATYKDLAEKDIEAALVLISVKMSSYNTCVIHCRQCVEKYLKNILARLFIEISDKISKEEFSEAMGGHSLKRLLYLCEKGIKNLREVREDIVLLNDYYTNVSYPGDTYIEVNKTLAEHLLNSTIAVRDVCIRILNKGVI